MHETTQGTGKKLKKRSRDELMKNSTIIEGHTNPVGDLKTCTGFVEVYDQSMGDCNYEGWRGGALRSTP